LSARGTLLGCTSLVTSGWFPEEATVSKELETLLEKARTVPMTEAERERQRRSFAYGNSKIENERVTRKMVDEQAEKLAKMERG